MLERKHAITGEVLEPITFVLAYRTAFSNKDDHITVLPLLAMTYINSPSLQSQVSQWQTIFLLTHFQPVIVRLQRHVWLYIQTFI
jgi:hypothetical protein